MQYVDYAVFWLTLSLTNAGLAQTKGRGGWDWWVLSLLLGPIATALIVIWPAVGQRSIGAAASAPDSAAESRAGLTNHR